VLVCVKVAEPPLSVKRPLQLLAAFPVPGESVKIDQFQTCVYWVKLQVPKPINPEHLIVEVSLFVVSFEASYAAGITIYRISDLVYLHHTTWISINVSGKGKRIHAHIEVKLKVRTRDIAALRETPPQKRSGTVWHVFPRDVTVLPAHPHVHPQWE